MSAKIFFDTNIYVYFFDDSNPKKKDIARELVRTHSKSGSATISLQVVQEFCNLALGKFRHRIEPDHIEKFLNKIMYPYCSVFPSFELIQRSLKIHRQYKYGFYDALIISAAVSGGCKQLITEDLQHGQKIEGVEIVNPFE